MLIRLKLLGTTLAATFSIASAASSESANVAAEAKVVLDGRFWSGGWPGGDVPQDSASRAATLVDDEFFSRGTRWDQGTVWWDARAPQAADNHVVLRWERPVEIRDIRIQGDDNDAYLLEYWTGKKWELVWQIPNHDRHGWGLQTFPDPNDADRLHHLHTPVVTSALRVSGDPTNGDKWFALSEVQAFGRTLE